MKSRWWKDSFAEKPRLSENLEWKLRRQFKANTELGVSWKEQMLQLYVISHKNVKREQSGLSHGSGHMWCQVWIHIVSLVKEPSVREAEKVRRGRNVGTTEYIKGKKRRITKQLWPCSFPLSLVPTSCGIWWSWRLLWKRPLSVMGKTAWVQILTPPVVPVELRSSCISLCASVCSSINQGDKPVPFL